MSELPPVVRSHMTEIMAGLPLELSQAFQLAAEAIPEVMEHVAANSSFEVVRTLVVEGYGELGGQIAGAIQADILAHQQMPINA